MTTQTYLALPVNVRLWVYSVLHQVMMKIVENERQKEKAGEPFVIDIQLILEISLDQIVARRLLPNDTLGYDLTSTMRAWQEAARDGFTLYDILKDRVPAEEREVFKDVSHETAQACFITALMLVREAQDTQENVLASSSHSFALSLPSPTPSVIVPPVSNAPSLTRVLWPLSVVVAGVLGVCVGVVL